MPKMASLFRKSLPFLLFTAISVGSFNCMKVDPAQKEQKQQEPLPEAKELAGLPPVEQLDTLVKMNSKDYVALMKQEIRKYKGEVKIGMDVQWLKPDGDFMIDFDFTGNTEKGWNYDCKYNRWCRPGYSPNDKIKKAEFKKDDYSAGIVNGVNAIITVLDKDPTAFDTLTPDSVDSGFIDSLIFLGIILIYLSAFLARSKRWWPGGVLGALLGLFLKSVFGVIALGLLGLLIDYFLSKNYKKRKKHGLPTSWISSMGGFSSGKSSGGFGGFGGGRSGGGGASGSW